MTFSDFLIKSKSLFFHFLHLHITTEAMGIWRFAGAFAVVERQKEMRAQRPLNARQPANGHRRVLAAGFLFIVSQKIRHLFFAHCPTSRTGINYNPVINFFVRNPFKCFKSCHDKRLNTRVTLFVP